MSQFDENFDWVVVGSGGAAMSAALYMAARGRKVLMLEKSDLVGGTTARSGGVMWIPNNPFLARDGIEDSYDKASSYLDALAEGFSNAPGATPARRHAFLTEAPRMVEFLLAQGVEMDRYPYWPDYHDELPGGLEVGRSIGAKLFNVNELGEWKQKLRPGFLEVAATLDEALLLPYFKRSWRSLRTMIRVIARTLVSRLTGKHYVCAGAALQGRMLRALLQSGVEIRIQSPVSELLVEEGRCVGVLTTRDGKPSRVRGELGVMVAAGGFAHNPRMREQYQPGTSPRWSSAAPTDTGEMLQEMVRLGAAVGQMDEMVGNQCVLPPESRAGEIQAGAQALTAKPHAILVDQGGERYMNEGGSYMAYCQGMLNRNRSVPAIPSWAIFDSQYLKKYMLAGTLPGSRKPASWYKQGFLKRADSLEALAGQIDVDPASLVNTVERFNGFAANNHDDDFNRGDRAYDRWLGDSLRRPAISLGKIERAPFYAVAVYPGDVGTFGGVVTDEHARVRAEDGSVIPGLYAAGVCTASVMGRAYPGAGSSVGPALTWGYIGARHALGLD